MKPVRKEQAQSGAMTIMEAAFVFPIMFLVIVIMVMLGEAYYQHARVEYEVSHAAVSGAARCENPMLAYVQNNGNTVPTSPSATKVVPYRYIFTGKAQQIGTDGSLKQYRFLLHHCHQRTKCIYIVLCHRLSFYF